MRMPNIRHTLLAAMLPLLAQPAFARAGSLGEGPGGFGYNGPGGPHVGLVPYWMDHGYAGWKATPFTVLLALVVAAAIFLLFLTGPAMWRSWRLSRKSRQLLEKIAAQDPAWNPQALQARIKAVFFSVQQAWTRRDPAIARGAMSDRLYNHHEDLIGAMKQRGEHNVLERIELVEARIVQVDDRLNDNLDRFSALIVGRMIDYTVNEHTQEILRGDRLKPDTFEELWRFVRTPQGWMLDEISRGTELRGVPEPSSESLAGQ